MQLTPKHPKRFCPMGCRCRSCRQLQHSGLGIDARRPDPLRAVVWRLIFAAYTLTAIGGAWMAWEAWK